MVLTKFFILLFFIFNWRITVVRCFRDAFWSVHGWNDMMSGGCFKIIWDWEKVGGIVDKIRWALHWHLLKLGDSWGTLRFIYYSFYFCAYWKISIIKNEEKSRWINIYWFYSRKPEVLFIVMWSISAFVLHAASSGQNNIITILDYESIEWVWYLSTEWDLLNSIQYSQKS